MSMHRRKEARPRTTWRAKFLLLAGSLVVCFLLLLAGELACRLFTDIHFRGNSRNLFVADAFGSSKGNAPNVEAVSFGTKVYTDANGFRVPRGAREEPDQSRSAILILGDSVGFGPGVPEEHTFAGRLRKSFPSTRIYNASVIGYGTHDYKNLVENFVPSHEEIRSVILLFCLNDLKAESAKLIDEALKTPNNERGDRPANTVEALKQVSWIRTLNDFLRPRSKLYLLLKNKLTKSKKRAWKWMLSQYTGDVSNFRENMQPIADTAEILERRGIDFAVIISPFESQLREAASEEAMEPQRMLAAFFEEARVPYFDAAPVFKSKDEPSTKFFIDDMDPWHLSEFGHDVVHEIIMGIISGDFPMSGERELTSPTVTVQPPPLLPDDRPPALPPCPTDQLLSYWTMAGQNGRMVDQMHSTLLRWNLTWKQFVQEYVQPELELGYRRVMLHLPFGKDTEADSFMSFDSYIHAQQRDLDTLWKGFSKAWRPVVQGKYTDGEPVQVICYLGSLHHDPDFTKLLEDPTKGGQWLSRAWKSTQAILDAGCEIAFDTAGGWPADSPGYGFVTLIRNMGAGGWIEGTEFVRRPADQPYRWRDPITNEFHYWNPELIVWNGHWRGFNVTANHGHYWRNMTKTDDGLGHPPSGRYDSIEHYGEVILLLDGHSAPLNEDGTKKTLQEISDTFPEWAPPMVRRNIEAGFSTAVAAHATRRHNLTPEKLLGCLSASGGPKWYEAEGISDLE